MSEAAQAMHPGLCLRAVKLLHSCRLHGTDYWRPPWYADGNGVAVTTGGFFGWWPWSWPFVWTDGTACNVNGVWGPNGGVITGTTSNGGFAAAGASAQPSSLR